MNNIADIKEVASKANVSIGTVSNVFKHPEKVALKTRDKVMAVAHELGFTPNPLASAMVTSRTNIIGLMVSYSPSYYSGRGRAVNEFTKAAADLGYVVLLAITDMDTEKEKRAVEYFTKYKVDGVVVYASYAENQSSHFARLADAGIPTIVFKRYNKAYENIIVSADKAYQDLAEQLRKYRHKEVGVLLSGHNSEKWDLGIKGKRIITFREKLVNVGIPLPDENMLQVGEESIQSGENAVDMWLSARNHLPSVFFCFYEEIAIGAMRRLQERGYRVPADISFVAYSSSQIGQFCSPRLATISIDEADMMLKALEMLCRRIDNPEGVLTDYELAHKFEFHESLGPARKEI